ncbi:MAG TPA: hypothetical protein VKI62_06720, partial [Bacteroidota bacterium]|nr:hypothetical protein [Bacteroidota bacterium]
MIRLAVFIVCYSLCSFSQDRDKSLGEIHGKITILSKDELTEEIMHGRMIHRYGMDPSMSNKPVQPYKLSEEAVIFVDSVGGSV